MIQVRAIVRAPLFNLGEFKIMLAKVRLDALVRAANCASHDPARPGINGVRVEPYEIDAPCGAVVVATNGHILSAEYVRDAICKEGFTITLPAIKILRDAQQSMKSRFRLTRSKMPKIEMQDFDARVVCCIFGDHFSISDPGPDGMSPGLELKFPFGFSPVNDSGFPNWFNCLPHQRGEARVHVNALNADYVSRLAAASSNEKTSQGGIELWYGEINSPIYVTRAANPDWFGLLMPVATRHKENTNHFPEIPWVSCKRQIAA